MAKVELVLEIPLVVQVQLEQMAREQPRRYGPGPVDAAERLLAEAAAGMHRPSFIVAPLQLNESLERDLVRREPTT